MIINSKLQSLRTITRKNSKTIINKVINDHNVNICMFCSSIKNLTKEHVIPRWIFDNCTDKFFTTNINKIKQTYNKTTIPACSVCNSELLSLLEKYIKKLFIETELKNIFFLNQEIQNIVKWLEIIDYKFQILNIRRKFLASKEHGYIPYLADLPISILRHDNDYTPSKVFSEIRRSQKRITTKTKTQNINSLVVFRTSNLSFHFFHNMDDFIFMELPKQKIALFYFYKKIFDDVKEAHEEAMKIIKKFY